MSHARRNTRIGVLLAAAAEALLWGVVTFRGDLLPRPRDPAGFHFFFLFCVLPAAGLALWGRGINVAIGLVIFTAFVYVSTVLAGFISG